jgi:hypothetical protein
MTASKKNTNYKFSLLLVLVGLAIWLALPNLPTGRAHASGGAGKSLAQKPSVSGLNSERRTALEKLYAQFKAGVPFSEEESNLLRQFGTSGTLTDLEADVLISRALYDYYIAAKELTKDQQELLDQYSLSVARRPTDVADLKTQLLNKRIAAAAAAPPHIPQVAPSNDLCAGAEVIPAAGPFPYFTATTADVTDATVTGDPPLPSCQTNVSRSIWYRFTPSATGTYTISSCSSDGTNSTVDDTVMAVYTSTGGCGGTFTEVPTGGATDGCDDDSCVSEVLQSFIMTQLNGGTTYYIVVWTFAPTPLTAGSTAIQLRVTAQLPPTNDTCSSPQALTLNTSVNGTTLGAVNDYQLSGATCFTGIGNTSSGATGRDVVYSFTAPTAGNYSFRVTNFNVISNLVLYVMTSCPAATLGTPVNITCNNVSGPAIAAANRANTSSAEEVMCLALTASQQVFIVVDEAVATSGNAFTIEVNGCTRETEANGTPATANAFTFGVEGSITPAGDVDFFSLGTLPANTRVFALVDGVAGNSSDFDLRVTTATDTLQYDDLGNDTPFGSLAPNIAGALATGVPTFLRVNHFTPGSVSEPYRLYAITQSAGANPLPNCSAMTTSATSETEPNNTIVQANTAGNKYFSGSLAGPAPSTDVDIFSFTATAGDLIFLSLDGDPCRDATPINPALALLNSAGATLVSVNDSSSTSNTASGAGSLTALNPFSPAEGIVYRATTTGTYYAQVFIGTNSSTTTGAGDYLLSIFTTVPTAAKFSNDGASNSISATRYDDGVSVKWRTGVEVDNLGFNVYREVGGQRVRVNSQIIAGSALMVGAGTSLGAGKTYAWFDNSPAVQGASYWVEAIATDGERSWHGPIATTPAVGKAADQGGSLTLGQLGKSTPYEGQTTRVERRAETRTVAASGVSIQAVIAGQQAAKLAVKNEGWYRVTQPELVAAGFNPNVDPRNLRLFVDGQEQPINVIAKDQFDASAAIEFYGVSIDSAFTDERVYWLAGGSQPGQRIQSIAAPGNAALSPSFLSTVERRDRTVYFPALRNGNKENFFGAVIARDPVDHALTLQHVDGAATGGAMLEVGLQGVTLFGHRVEVQINGKRAGEVTFNGQDAGVGRLAIAQSLLKEGANTVRLVPLGGATDISLVDYLRVTYWHTFVADNNQLRFNASSRQTVSVDGFSNAAIRVFDVTNTSAPQEILGAIKPTKAGYAVSVSVPGSGLRTLVAMTNDTAKHASTITLDQPSSWRQPGNAANFVIFTRREFMMALGALTALRQSQGYKVAVVDIEAVYNEFSYGNKTPQAIKDFLAYARSNWKMAPRFVMLAGDASFDPKNYLGFGVTDLVPTQLVDTQLLETASDDALADFNDDGVAEMAVGRLPIRTAREAAIMVNKLVGYDRSSRSEGVLLVADASSDGSSDFEAATADLRNVIPGDQRIEQINRSGLDPLTAKSRLIDAINRGQRIVNYDGHANIDALRGGLLTAEDVSSLSNGENLSLFVMMTCLTGYFHDAQLDSLAEALMRAEKGGACAVWASSGMTVSSDQGVMDMEMFRRLFDANGGATLGEAAMQAKAVARR